jgi:phage/plasmid-associated DNA primase
MAEKALEEAVLKAQKIISARHPIIDFNTDVLYLWEGGYYKRCGRSVLKKMVAKSLGDSFTSSSFKTSMEYIEATCHEYIEWNHPTYRCVRNGLFHLPDLEFFPGFKFDIRLRNQINAIYNKDIGCSSIKEYVKGLVDDEKAKAIQEFVGLVCFDSWNTTKTAMHLIGKRNSGKSTLIKLITNFVGYENVEFASLKQLCDKEFLLKNIDGKLLNSNADEVEEIKNLEVLKRLTGNDYILCDVKHSNTPIRFTCDAKLLFSGNKEPTTDTMDAALAKRWNVIEFEKEFPNNYDFEESMRTDEMRSQWLNYAMEGFLRIKANGWKYSYEKNLLFWKC